MKSFLTVEVVWKDNDMIELEVVASNGQFSGTTRIYTQGRVLYKFAYALQAFPAVNESSLFYEAGEKDSYAYFSMRFYTIGDVGHLGVQVTLESDVPTIYRAEEKDKLTLEILTAPGFLDNFVKSLLTMAQEEAGRALLEGVRAG